MDISFITIQMFVLLFSSLPLIRRGVIYISGRIRVVKERSFILIFGLGSLFLIWLIFSEKIFRGPFPLGLALIFYIGISILFIDGFLLMYRTRNSYAILNIRNITEYKRIISAINKALQENGYKYTSIDEKKDLFITTMHILKPKITLTIKMRSNKQSRRHYFAEILVEHNGKDARALRKILVLIDNRIYSIKKQPDISAGILYIGAALFLIFYIPFVLL